MRYFTSWCAVALLVGANSTQARLQQCLVNNREFRGTRPNEEVADADGALACTSREGLLQGQVITYRVERADTGIGQNEDFTTVVAYGDDCTTRSFAEFLNAQTTNLTFNRAASCLEEGNICDRPNILLEGLPAGNDTQVCLRIRCDNTALDCDLKVFMDITENIASSGSVLCGVSQRFEIPAEIPLLPGNRHQREFECGGGLFSDDLASGATLSYNIRVTENGDMIKVYHANGDNCGRAPGDADFQSISASSCDADPVDACSFSDVTVPSGGPDCVIVECQNTITDCDVQVDITWRGNGAGRTGVPALFIALLAITFTIWS